MNFEMFLHNDPFIAINSGLKTIEMRLYTKERQKIKVNDTITFTNRDSNEKVKVLVLALYPFNDFKEIYEHFDKIDLGYKENEIANYKDMNLYYSNEDIKKYKTLAIKIKKI